MIVNIDSLTGIALDYAVAVAEGFGAGTYMRNIVIRHNVNGGISCISVPIGLDYVVWKPSSKWNQGGPIIEREGISIKENLPASKDNTWNAFPSITTIERRSCAKIALSPQ